MRAAFEYAVVRVVPDASREEFVNVGVLVLCERAGVLRAVFALDDARVSAFAPGVDLELVRAQLDAMERVARGAEDGGGVARLPPRERFGWLVSPRSTMLQTSAPHGGVTDDLDVIIDRLVATMVRAKPHGA